MKSLYFDAEKPMGYKELNMAVENLRTNFESFKCFSIGKTVLARRIPCIVLGKGSHPVLFVGAHHALEYITSMILVDFVGNLFSCAESGKKFFDTDVTKLLENRCIYIIPMLNPDGVELHLNGLAGAGKQKKFLEELTGGDFSNWQANAHGVDLNHNYNAGFKILHKMEEDSGITGPAPTRFGGKRPESEPETHALCNLCRRMSFSQVYALHSQGEEIYWNYGDNTPSESREIAEALGNASGYTVSEPEGLASHGGFKDWFVDVYCRPGFTVEVGLGKNPLPLTQLEDCTQKCSKLLLEALKH